MKVDGFIFAVTECVDCNVSSPSRLGTCSRYCAMDCGNEKSNAFRACSFEDNNTFESTVALNKDDLKCCLHGMCIACIRAYYVAKLPVNVSQRLGLIYKLMAFLLQHV